MVNCPRCNFQPTIHPEHGSLYNAYCGVCNDHFCGLCATIPDHFPAWCSDRAAWIDRTIHRTNGYYVAANFVRNLNQQRIAMFTYRDDIGHEQYDHHPHMSYAVGEMQRIMSILAWTRVIAFLHPNMQLLQSWQFTQLELHLGQLRNQFVFDFENDGAYNLFPARRNACNSVVPLLGLLQERHEGAFDHAVHIPPRARHEVSFSQNMSRVAVQWTRSATRAPPPPPPAM